jgi:hypothetical protein
MMRVTDVILSFFSFFFPLRLFNRTLTAIYSILDYYKHYLSDFVLSTAMSVPVEDEEAMLKQYHRRLRRLPEAIEVHKAQQYQNMRLLESHPSDFKLKQEQREIEKTLNKAQLEMKALITESIDYFVHHAKISKEKRKEILSKKSEWNRSLAYHLYIRYQLAQEKPPSATLQDSTPPKGRM